MVSKKGIRSRNTLVRYILDIAQKSNIDLSIASERETRQILDRLPSLSEEIVKNRHK
jgi:hypothetical protein